MPVPSAISDLSQTAGSNFPAGSESPTTADDYLRTYAAFIATLRDGKGASAEASVASAATTDIGAANSPFVQITGTTTITSFGANYNGPRFVRFAAALTLTHNASTLILPGAANITTAAGDSALVLPISGGWRVVAYTRAANSPDSPTFTSVTASSFNGGQLAGMRNRLINGSFLISQRATSATVTAGTAVPTASTGYPCVDRWFVYSTGANVTAAQVNGANATSKRLQITGAASVTAVGVGQRIEAANCYDLAGSTVTLSVDLANSLLTTVTWTASYANTADTFGTIGTPTKTQIATGTFTVNSTVTRYSTQISIPAAATTGIEILFTVGAQTSGTFTIGAAQFESGSVATPFELRLNELQLAQRYYEKSYDIATPPGTATSLGASVIRRSISAEAATLFNESFAVVKRSTPVVTWYNSNSGASGQIYNASLGALTVTGMSTVSQTSERKLGSPAHAANGSAGEVISAHWAASAEIA